MNNVEKNMAVDALVQLMDQQPTAYAEVLEACRAMGWNASPTAQPADIIDELPSNVLPFIRRMLTLLIYGDGSADSPAVVPATDRLYAQMLARQTDYPAAGFPSDPSDPFTPMSPTRRDFAHLPQALSALSPRKITNGGATNDGIPDGVSLAHLLCDADISVTELNDETHGWVLRRELPTMPACKKVTLGCKSMPIVSLNPFANAKNVEEAIFPDLEALDNRTYEGENKTNVFIGSKLKKLEFPKLKTIHCNNMNGEGFFRQLSNDCEILMPNCTYFFSHTHNPCVFSQCTGVTRIVLGTLTMASNIFANSGSYGGNKLYNLIDFEIGSGTAINLDIRGWNPTNVLADADKTATFLQNFRDHIALRLTDNGSGLTLTLSQAVRDAIHAAESTYGIENIIVTQKGWTLSPAPTE